MVRQTGKEKAARIPLDYFKRADPLIRTRLGLMAAAAVVAVGFVAWGFLGPAGAKQHSHGSVATAHVKWEADCSACHRDCTPIRDDAWAANWKGDNGLPWIRENDAKCQICHAGPAHAAREKPAEVASCGSCHREHQGRLAMLTHVDDRACTHCHADLAGHTSGGKTKLENKVTSWQHDHPKFRSLESDPGTIGFTHYRHMKLGMQLDDKDRVQWKLEDVRAEDRDRYRQNNQGDHELVQLECSSCHQLDASSGADEERPAALTGLSPSGGAYMLPINYEQHCRACHPITIYAEHLNPERPEDLLPHRLSPQQIRTTLLGRLAGDLLKKKPDEFSELLRPAHPIPAKAGERPPGAAQDRLSKDVFKAQRHIRGICIKCHAPAKADATEPGIPESLAPAELSALIAAVEPAQVPQLWLRHARFDHAAHRSFQCRGCHEKAYTDESKSATANKLVLIDGRDKCLTCHSTAGGARHDCAECHTYHAADQLPHNHGALLRAPRRTDTPQDSP